MPDFKELSALSLFGNSVLHWAVAFAIALVAAALLVLLRRTIRGYYKRLQATEETELLELPMHVLSRTTLFFFLALSLYVGAQALTVTPKAAAILNSAVTIALFWQTGVWAVAFVDAWLERKRRVSMATNRAAVGSLAVVGFIVNTAIWAMVTLLTLDNLGVDITALVAGLGIGGVAVALAVQNVLGDVFASLSITFDRPFVVGDALSVGDFSGTVEYIGIKSTRLRSVSGEEIIISNSDLLSSRVRNYGRMHERRVVFNTSVAYETPVEKIERIPALIRDIVQAQPDTRFDRSHFAKHGPAALDFETVYFVVTADYNRYMDIQQTINLRLHRELAELGVEFAYPTQKLYVARVGKPDGAGEREEAHAAQSAA